MPSRHRSIPRLIARFIPASRISRSVRFSHISVEYLMEYKDDKKEKNYNKRTTILASLRFPFPRFISYLEPRLFELSTSRGGEDFLSSQYDISTTPLSKVRLIVTARVLRRVRLNRSIAVNWPFRCNIAARSLISWQLPPAPVIFQRAKRHELERI